MRLELLETPPLVSDTLLLRASEISGRSWFHVFCGVSPRYSAIMSSRLDGPDPRDFATACIFGFLDFVAVCMARCAAIPVHWPFRAPGTLDR